MGGRPGRRMMRHSCGRWSKPPGHHWELTSTRCGMPWPPAPQAGTWTPRHTQGRAGRRSTCKYQISGKTIRAKPGAVLAILGSRVVGGLDRLTGGYHFLRRPRTAGGAEHLDFLSLEMLEALIYYAGAKGGGGATKHPFRNSFRMIGAKLPG